MSSCPIHTNPIELGGRAQVHAEGADRGLPPGAQHHEREGTLLALCVYSMKYTQRHTDRPSRQQNVNRTHTHTHIYIYINTHQPTPQKNKLNHTPLFFHPTAGQNILASCSHPFILELLGTLKDQDQVYMLMELVQVCCCCFFGGKEGVCLLCLCVCWGRASFVSHLRGLLCTYVYVGVRGGLRACVWLCLCVCVREGEMSPASV